MVRNLGCSFISACALAVSLLGATGQSYAGPSHGNGEAMFLYCMALSDAPRVISIGVMRRGWAQDGDEVGGRTEHHGGWVSNGRQNYYTVYIQQTQRDDQEPASMSEHFGWGWPWSPGAGSFRVAWQEGNLVVPDWRLIGDGEDSIFRGSPVYKGVGTLTIAEKVETMNCEAHDNQ